MTTYSQSPWIAMVPMRTRVLATSILGFLAFVFLPARALDAQVTCAASGAQAIQILNEVNSLIGDTDSLTVSLRAKLGLSVTQPSSIVLVTAVATSKKAGQGLDKLDHKTPTTTRQVIVVKIGTVGFGVRDLRDFSVAGSATHFFSTTWAYKSTIGMDQ
ncbi:MAG: hypothetical protein ABI765_13075 [Gemmatimonadota bacterium]